MAKKIRLVEGTSIKELEVNANEALDSIESENIDIKYMLPEKVIILEYDYKPIKLTCMDCRFYDPNATVAKAWGICQCKGERKRFNEKSCEDFKDLRG